MTFLYSCKHSGDQYRITKFDENLDVESSYLCTFDECECPAAERGKTCRHMQMLPKFIHRGAVDTGWFFDFDRGGWVDMRTGEEPEPETVLDKAMGADADDWEQLEAALPAPSPKPSWRRH